MSALFNVMEQFFREDQWPFQSLPNQGALTTNYQGQSGSYAAVARVDEELQTISFATLYGRLVHPEARVRVLEFITRANFGLPLGCFTFEPDAGEVQFRTSIDVDGFAISTALVRNLVYTNCLAMDAYAPGIAKVLSSEASPEEAVLFVEEPE